MLIVFDDMNPVVTQLFIRGRKLNISNVFITQSILKVPKDVRLDSTHFFIMKIPNKRELEQIALSHLSNIDFKYFKRSIKNVPQNHILCWLMIQLYHQTTL